MHSRRRGLPCMYFTAEKDKEHHFVNGMPAIVDLEVVTVTGQRHGVHGVTADVEGHGRVSHYLVRVGYDCTVPMVLPPFQPAPTVG